MTKGIQLTIEDQTNGAEATFHTIQLYTVNFRGSQVTVVMDGYVSQQKQEEGKAPLMSYNVTIPQLPDTADVPSWIYNALTTQSEIAQAVPGGYPNSGQSNSSPYVGGKLIL